MNPIPPPNSNATINFSFENIVLIPILCALKREPGIYSTFHDHQSPQQVVTKIPYRKFKGETFLLIHQDRSMHFSSYLYITYKIILEIQKLCISKYFTSLSCLYYPFRCLNSRPYHISFWLFQYHHSSLTWILLL